jgi:hypothetical protein
MVDAFLKLDAPIQAAIISAVIGLIAGLLGAYIKHFLDKRSFRDKLETEYEYGERKKLRELIGRYHGRLLEASERLNHRLWNLQENESKGWLNVKRVYDQPDKNYYFTTTVYRFVRLLFLIRLFDEEAIFIDSRFAKEGEFAFAKFLKALEWSLTDADLFDDIRYDTFHQTDHVFRDKLRLLCDSCIDGDNAISLEKFHARLTNPDEQLRLVPLLNLFDGLCSTEKRLRWDRIAVFHLLLMAFINNFGYDIQQASRREFTDIAASVRNRQVLHNLAFWLPRLGLDKETKNLKAAISSVIDH